MTRNLIILCLLSIPLLYAEQKAENRSFEDQFQKISLYLSENSINFKKGLFEERQESLVESLLSITDTEEEILEFLEKSPDEKALVISKDLSQYTTVILNPIIEQEKIYYPLFFADISDISNMKGLILYAEGSGKIVRARIKQQMTPAFLIKLVDDSFFPDECEMIMKMIDIRKGGRKRSFTFKISAVRNFASVMEFMAPKREIGKKILLKKNSLWMYSPKISRPVRLSTRQKFMGSSFSNNDLMDISFEDDYNITVEAFETVHGARCIKLLLIAKNNSVTYPKMELWFNTNNFVTSRIYYYTPSGKILKKMETRKLKLLGGRERPSELVMQNMFEKDSKTIIVIKDIIIKKIPLKTFTESYLKR